MYKHIKFMWWGLGSNDGRYDDRTSCISRVVVVVARRLGSQAFAELWATVAAKGNGGIDDRGWIKPSAEKLEQERCRGKVEPWRQQHSAACFP